MPRPLLPPRLPAVFSPTVTHPLVDDFTLRAARMRARVQPPGVQQVFPIPMRNNPLWSGNSELGAQADFAPDSNNRQTILKLEEWGEPRVWSVMLGIAYSPALLSDTSFFDLTAEIQAGVGGVTQEFEVDWGEGTLFSCPFNALSVIAKYTVIGGTVLQVPSDLKLRASVGRNEHNNPSSPTRSITTPSIPAGTFTTTPLIIPKFARRLTPLSSFGLSAPYAATTSYLWQNNPTIPSTIGSFTGTEFAASFGANGIPIPTDARALIVNNAAGIATRVRLMFHLAL